MINRSHAAEPLAEREPADTKTNILDTAERLFARSGVQGVSVRTILSDAGVNMALAQYHFGGRDGLIRAVLVRRIEPLNERRLQLLAEAEAAARPQRPGVEAILRAFFAPVVDLLEEHPDFARLLGQVHVTPDPKVRLFYGSLFGELLRRFGEAIREALPAGLTKAQRRTRAQFIFGVMVQTINSYGAATDGTFEPLRGEPLLRELVAFCSAGLCAPPPTPS
jgi:AcrR family transcriptional regulator